MDFKTAIQRQTHAALAMLIECVEDCPEPLWLSGEHPRFYWKVAYHAATYADCFLSPSFDSWERWEHHRREAAWTFADEGETIPSIPPYTTGEVMTYLSKTQSEVDSRIEALDVEADECGFPWYSGLSRSELLILNVRHISEHVGQLHELRIAAGLDVDWRTSKES